MNAVRIHPNFDGDGNQYDHAILQVKTPFSLPSINLPVNQDEITSLLNKNDCEFWGYGLDNDRKAGKLNGIVAEFNGAIFGDGLVGVGGKNWPIQGDSGGGLYCKNQDGQRVRVGTVSRAEVGLSSVASLGGALDWIKDNLKQAFPDGENSGPTVQPQKTESRIRSERQTGGGELYDDCVAHLNLAAQSDSSGYLKQHLSEVVARQCRRSSSSPGDTKSKLITALSAFAKASCQSSSKWFWQDSPPDDAAANKIAHCFLEQDFWSASDKYEKLANGENIAGTGTGLAMACTKALGFTCGSNFMIAGVQAHMPDRLQII